MAWKQGHGNWSHSASDSEKWCSAHHLKVLGFEVKRGKREQGRQKDQETEPELPFVMNSAGQTQYAVGHEQETMRKTNIKVGFKNIVAVFQRHGNTEQ